ncbi:MAG: host specificity factor TipJ family phage tail protein, partial [Alcaligenes sp.]
MLLNLAFPPPRPNAMQGREQASPTHTLSAQGNMARLREAIPVLYGRHLIYPDFASQPYTEADSNSVFLYQLFCLGQGELEIEKIRIEETPIENFAEVTWEVVRPGGRVTLFPDNVVTSSAVQNLELKAANEEGGGGYVGPFVSNPAGTTCNAIGIDISTPTGLFYAHRDGLRTSWLQWHVEVRPINDAGAPVGDWSLLTDGYWQDNTATPQIRSYRHAVPDGRYEVRAIRVNPKILDEQCQNTCVWAGLRAYLPSRESYGDVTLLAVAARATNNLNQSTARRVNVIATRKLQTWDPMNGWSQNVRATRSPAWAIADMLRNRTYGRGMQDTAYNLPELYRLAQVWEQRGDYYDDVIDTTMTLWEALSRAARVGRAMPMYYAGLIDFVRNEPRS